MAGKRELVKLESEKYGTSSLGSLYFCVPQNEKQLAYWDMIEDRLFKIRHCLNLEGVKRELALWDPPIDPELLVRAVAAGLDISEVHIGLYAPLPHYRFTVLLQKAAEFCNELKGLGSSLLSALEKKDAEALALLRSDQEIGLLTLITQIKDRQVDEARANLEALTQSQMTVLERFNQYQKLMGNPAVALKGDELPTLESSSSLVVAANAPGDAAGLGLIPNEIKQLDALALANTFMVTAGILNTVAGVVHNIPDIQSGSPFYSMKIGGSHLGSSLNSMASLFNTLGTNESHNANRANIIGGYQRRRDEWVHQSKLALAELKQLQKQKLAAEIRLQIAEREVANHQKQIEHANELRDFMHEKYTNQELYSWMSREISDVYFRTYQLAHDMAKRAEKAYIHEQGIENASFIQPGQWDSLKKGLLSGEKLGLDLKRMESAYLEQNKREFEITKHVSLRQLNPYALILLKTDSKCEVELPEALFDIDFPGHYFRRIKSISISIPCIVGPYTSVSGTLTLLSSTLRKSSLVKGGSYSHGDNFLSSYLPVQSIATSGGQNDSGLFELNFRDERYLPFEGAGAISKWRIELPKDFPQFDYDTISDVILHVRYTSRDGGDTLKDKATAELKEALKELIDNTNKGKNLIDSTNKVGLSLSQGFSLRQDFPAEWHRFTNEADEKGNHKQGFNLSKQRFPFLFHGPKVTIIIHTIHLLGIPKKDDVTKPSSTSLPSLRQPPTKKEESVPVLVLKYGKLKDGEPIGSLIHKEATVTVKFDAEDKDAEWILEATKDELAALEDILLICIYTVTDS